MKRTIQEIKEKWFWFTVANHQILIDIKDGDFFKNRWHLHALIFPIVVIAWMFNFCYIPELPIYLSIPITYTACTILAWIVEVAEITYQNRNGKVRGIEFNLEDWKDVIITSYFGLLGVITGIVGAYNFGYLIVLYCVLVLIVGIYCIFEK